MSLIKALFFDLDGTLVNTYEADYRAYSDAIKEVTGIDIEREAFMQTHGQEMRKKIAVLTPTVKENEIKRIGESKKKHYAKYTHLTIPNIALISFLSMIADEQKAVLVTTAKRQNALLVLKAHDIFRHFDEMVFGDEVESSKPSPEPYLLALKKMNLLPYEVIAFEDSEVGIASAKAAGISVIKVRSPV